MFIYWNCSHLIVLIESLFLQNLFDLAMMAKSNRGLRNNKY